MFGLMMQRQLTLTGILRYAQENFSTREIVSVTAGESRHRYGYGDAFARAAQLANVLASLGARPGDRIGTLAWNDHRHFEIYYATSCSGLVCHTINPRLFREQIAYIIQHAEDRWLFVDPAFVPMLETIAGELSGVKGFVILCDGEQMPATGLPNTFCYEELIVQASADFDWPELDEQSAAALCYTSGTTGNPKGVLYSHRALTLHTYGLLMPGAFQLQEHDVVMPVVPMFHVNAWSLPYAAPITGAKLVLPGPKMGCGETLCNLIQEESITTAAGVPTVWLALLQYLRESGKHIPSLQRVIVGGAACPWSIMQEFEEQHGVYTHHAWGMTEMSPVGTFNGWVSDALPAEERRAKRLKQGRAAFGVEMRIVDDVGTSLPRDGKSVGNLQVRGPWICERYFRAKNSALSEDGWFDTGDVACIDREGYLGITDRTKDVVKSGGEWISSIELENLAVALPQVREAAVIGIPHEKWDERPLLVVVAAPGAVVDPLEILHNYRGKVASWWIPDDCVLVETLPHTATGKISKKDLRAQLADYRWPQSLPA